MKPVKIERIHYDSPISVYDVVNAFPYNNFIVRCGNDSIVSHNCIMMDETNFAKAGVKDINKAKSHMKSLYDTANARISGTFRINGEVYGKLIAASSKNTDSDFLSDHIEKQLNAGNTGMMLIDEPQWKILPKSMFSDKKFYFTVGDRYKKGFVVPAEHEDKEHFDEYLNQGYKIIEAPAELRKNFLADYDISLRDIAGISVVGAMGFIPQEVITPNISQTRRNPFYTDEISVGTQDNQTIEQYFHLEAVPPNIKRNIMNIHLDLAETGDRQGMAGTCVDGNKIVQDFSGKKVSQPFFRQVFAVGVKSPRGDRMSFQKVVNFILWLQRNGFIIGTISTDQYQSSYLREILAQQGFKTKRISVDASEEPYIGLKNVLYDQRIELVKNQLQEDELVHLQRINGKIDHPATGCFTEDTMIQLVDGRSLSIHDLMIEQSYKSNWVYTFNECSKRIEPKRIKKIFQTKLVSTLCKVTLDNGQEIFCTPEHRFMLRDGSFDNICNLRPGDSLMPLYTKESEKGLQGYRLYYEPEENCWHYEHRMFVDAKQGTTKNDVVHHCNYNKADNTPSNLKWLTKSEHRKIHNNHTQDYHKQSTSVKIWHLNHRGSEVYMDRSLSIKLSMKAKQLGLSKDAITTMYNEDPSILMSDREKRIALLESYFNVSWESLSKRDRSRYGFMYNKITNSHFLDNFKTAMKNRPLETELKRKEAARQTISNRRWYTNGKDNIYIDVSIDPPEGFVSGRTLSNHHQEMIRNRKVEISEERRNEMSKETSSRIWVTNGHEAKYIHRDSDIPEGFIRGRSCYKRNHQIAKIEYIHKPCRVFDLEIEDNHNFALSAGVFVHNSKDISDCLCGSVWTLVEDHVVSQPSRKSVVSAIAAVNTNNRTQGNSLPMFNNGYRVMK